jgi:hypothetical protein
LETNQLFISISMATGSVHEPANVHANGKRPIKDGFELLGRRFYGNALILADDGRTSPRVTPKQIAPAVYFFREDGH